MNPTLRAMLRLTEAIAETHNNPLPLFRLWTAISETKDILLIRDSHKMVKNTLVSVLVAYRPSNDIEPYDLDESTLLDQIISDLGEHNENR